jgi:hypothetical protein
MEIWGGIRRGIRDASTTCSGVCQTLRGLRDPKLPLSAPIGGQLGPTSPKLVEDVFSEVGIALVPWYWLTLT